MLLVGFEPMTPVFDQTKIFHTSDRSATVIGICIKNSFFLNYVENHKTFGKKCAEHNMYFVFISCFSFLTFIHPSYNERLRSLKNVTIFLTKIAAVFKATEFHFTLLPLVRSLPQSLVFFTCITGPILLCNFLFWHEHRSRIFFLNVGKHLTILQTVTHSSLMELSPS
jgi:hypothetical protein